jgi:hypothetical protein
MQKLILRYFWDDGGAYCGHEHLPFEYPSQEQAFVDFFTLYEKKDPFFFLGEKFEKGMLCYDPEILTLDEWFETNKIN